MSNLQGVATDETVAANPEEIELDEDGLDDEEAAGDAVDRTAEAAKQDMADDNGMFHAESLHNYCGSTQAAPNNQVEAADEQSPHVETKRELPAALAAILEASDHDIANAQKPTGPV